MNGALQIGEVFGKEMIDMRDPFSFGSHCEQCLSQREIGNVLSNPEAELRIIARPALRVPIAPARRSNSKQASAIFRASAGAGVDVLVVEEVNGSTKIRLALDPETGFQTCACRR